MFEDVSYESFRRRALDPSLSQNEKMGFPDVYRHGKETLIFADITSKLSRLGQHGQIVIDLGAGCGPLALLIMEHCERQGHLLLQVDSPEMLALLPPGVAHDHPDRRALPGRVRRPDGRPARTGALRAGLWCVVVRLRRRQRF